MRALVAISCVVGVLAVLAGCIKEDLVRPDRNRPPETFLTVGPDMGDRVFHKYLVRWTGFDRDGVVVAYKVAAVSELQLYGGRVDQEDIEAYLFELPWRVTDATESLFVFRADMPNSRNYSLYVVAIDNEGKEDPTPAATNFLAIDYGLPEISIKISSNVDSILPDQLTEVYTVPAYNLADPDEPIRIKIEWSGQDPDGEIVAWRYRIDSSPRQTVPADSTSIELVYDPSNPAVSDVWLGWHEFRLVAIDDANAESEESIARFAINFDPVTVIDSIWSFRAKTDNTVQPSAPLPDTLIYARAWRDSPDVYPDVNRIAYHFGQLKIKFHATDVDGPIGDPPPGEFKWVILGTFLKTEDWVSNPCGTSGSIDFYCDVTPSWPYLDSDRPYTLVVRSRDRYGKADGSPDTIMFEVNMAPKIVEGSLKAHPFEGVEGKVKFTWDAIDPDEGYGWGVAVGEYEQAMIKYRYRIDGGIWQYVTAVTRAPRRYKKEAIVEGLEPGHHTFELHAYNGDYFETRADRDTLDFDL